jgi:hypothetical protein
MMKSRSAKHTTNRLWASVAASTGRRKSAQELRAYIAAAIDRGDDEAASKRRLELFTLAFGWRSQFSYQKIAYKWLPLGEAEFIPDYSQQQKNPIFDQLLIDRGEQGTVTLVCDTPKNLFKINFEGAIRTDPEALILAALHAKKHWGGYSLNRGDPEFVFLAMVADELVGVRPPSFGPKSLRDRFSDNRPPLFSISPDRRAEAEELKKKWQPIYKRLLAEQAAPPKRPAKTRRDRAPVREAAMAAAA